MKNKTICIILTAVIFLNISVYAEPSVSAQAAILTEVTSGRVLFTKNSETRLAMASTTKIITALVAIENGESILDEMVEVSASAAGVEGSSMYLEKGEKMTLRELLYGLMLSSGNDAAVAIAETISGSAEEFVKLMNQKAEEIGLKDTHFTNPNGLPDENHYSTAADMAKMTGYAMQNPVFTEIVSTKTYSISGDGKAYPRTLSNHNKLLKMYDGCIGVKTGFTKAAGRCLVSSAKRDGMTLVCVTLNAPNDWSDHTAMLDYGFEVYKMVKLADKTKPIAAAEAEGSVDDVIPVYPKEDIYFPLCEGERVDVEAEVYPRLSAPIKKGEAVGKLRFNTDKNAELSRLLAEKSEELVVQRDVKAEPQTKRLGKGLADSLKLFFGRWISLLLAQNKI